MAYPRAYRVGGLVVGLVAAVLLNNTPASWLGLGTALTGPAFGLCLLVGVVLGELRPLPAGPRRTATLEVRAVTRYLPRALTTWVAVVTLVLAGFLILTTAFGSADDMGRAGRSLTVTCGPDRGFSAGPWPGLFYSVPIGAAVGLGLAAAVLAARIVARRRRPQTDDARTDDRARRTSTRTIVAACGVLTAAPLAGAAFIAGGALRNVDCGGSLLPALSWSSLGLSVAATLAAAFCAAMVIRTGS
jgi:TRAP-type C4-dicarboxylate transport system permease small subunit